MSKEERKERQLENTYNGIVSDCVKGIEREEARILAAQQTIRDAQEEIKRLRDKKNETLRKLKELEDITG